MMNTIKSAMVGLALVSAPVLAEECAAPDTPVLPDGSTASLEQMLEGQAAVKAYLAGNTEYRACLEPLIKDAEVAASGDDPILEESETVDKLNAQYNESVSSEEEVAGKFNTQLQAYKAANPG